MSTKICIGLIGLSCLLTGCATTEQLAVAEQPARAETAVAKPANPAPIYVDDAYVAYVEHMARVRGITLRWINKPRKRTTKQE